MNFFSVNFIIMDITLNLFSVTKKTSFADVILLLNSIEVASRSFYRIKARRAFIQGCLSACGFEYSSNFASRFSRVYNISSDNNIYRLPYSCSYGRWGSRYCFDVDISGFN